LSLLARNAEIYGDQIVFEAPLGNIGYWHGANDHVVWTVELSESGRFDVWLDWACDDSVAGNRFVLAAAAEELRGTVVGTGGWDRYRQQKLGTLTLPAGMQCVSLRPDGTGVNGALMDLRGVRLVAEGSARPLAAAAPESASPAGDPATVAAAILDEKRAAKEREELVRGNLDRAAEIVAAMTADLAADSKEEYRRIPWIWRVAIASGKK